MERLLLFALLHEAEETIKRLQARAVSKSCYLYDSGKIVLTGLGSYAAMSAVFTHPSNEIWNLGLAGALAEDLPIGEVATIGHVEKYVPHAALDEHAQNLMYSHLLPIRLEGTYRLATSDFPIHAKEHRPNCELVDMEGYGIAYAAKCLKRPCRIWKVISDFAGPGGPALILKHKKELSKRLADLVEDESSCYS